MASALDDNPEDTENPNIADSDNENSKRLSAEEPEETSNDEESEGNLNKDDPEESPTEEKPEETPTDEEPEETPTEEEPEETPTEEEPEETPTEKPKETPAKEKPVKENPNKGNSDNKKIIKNQNPDNPPTPMPVSTPTPAPSPTPTSSPSPETNSTPDSSSNSGSDSNSDTDSDTDSESSMGSGVSQESPGNIEVKELATRHVIGGYHINYEFMENATCITFIEYDAKRTFRKTTTIVEVLKDKSSLVSSAPAGKIYEHVNIWVGEQGGGLPTSIKNGVVGFRIEKAWIKNNNVDEAFITLQWYDKEWQPLYTEKTGEDQDYVYFIASTPGYSSFAITEYTAGEIKGEDKNSGKIQEVILRNLHSGKQENMLHGNIEKNTEDVGPMQAAKVLMAISLPAFLLVVGYCVLKKKI
ncbi:MAG: PGF-pre-PGF domain-containing protein [Methanosarcina sp.]